MKNTKMLPFERNRYFTGKMLTSSDFQTEQNYVNNKRRFINNMMFGSGIVCGMSVYNLDERTLYIDSGVAIDGLGREIVIPEACVRKLSAIEGFDGVKSNVCKLYVKYDEEEVQPVYSASRRDKSNEYENNRITEQYKLYLVDAEQDDSTYKIPSEFLSESVLYQNEDIRISIKMPAIVCVGKKAKIKVAIEKLTEEEVEVSYSGLLQFPSFTMDDGKHETNIELDHVSLEKNEALTKEIWVKVNNTTQKETSIIIKAVSVVCVVNGVNVAIHDDMMMKIVSENMEPRQLVNLELGKTGYELKNTGGIEEAVGLAQITINRISDSYEIVAYDEKTIKKYIETPADEEERKEYLDYFQSDLIVNPVAQQTTESSSSFSGSENPNRPELTSGIAEIPIGKNLKKGEICFSDEIVHGLGKGNVYVSLGNEMTEKNQSLDRSTSVTVIGNGDIFQSDNDGMKFETAVKILNEKGSFIVGIKAKKDVECLIVRYRWYAMNYTKEQLQSEIPLVEDKRITVETPTVVLKPGENYFFNVRFNYMEATQLGYELTESGSGTVTMDGIYTAPNKEGVFELRIYCLNDPSICTYAYAIVKRNNSL